MIAFLDMITAAFEPFPVLLALVPLIGYLLVFSVIRLSGRALVTTGGRDVAVLAMGISGLIAVGPLELFFPTAAAMVFGWLVWFALAGFYGLCVTLIALTVEPKLVIYGRSPDESFDAVLQAARKLDSAATGDDRSLQIEMPSVGLRLRVDGHRGIDYSQVLAFEPNVAPKFWGQMLSELRSQVSEGPVPNPRRGFAMLVVALGLGAFLAWQSFGNQELVVEGFRNWLWR